MQHFYFWDHEITFLIRHFVIFVVAATTSKSVDVVWIVLVLNGHRMICWFKKTRDFVKEMIYTQANYW